VTESHPGSASPCPLAAVRTAAQSSIAAEASPTLDIGTRSSTYRPGTRSRFSSRLARPRQDAAPLTQPILIGRLDNEDHIIYYPSQGAHWVTNAGLGSGFPTPVWPPVITGSDCPVRPHRLPRGVTPVGAEAHLRYRPLLHNSGVFGGAGPIDGSARTVPVGTVEPFTNSPWAPTHQPHAVDPARKP
jgi:hypothetical protein